MAGDSERELIGACQNCGQRFSAPARLAGRKGRCTKCGETVVARDPRVPRALPLAAEEPESETVSKPGKLADTLMGIAVGAIAVPAGVFLIWLLISSGAAGDYFALFGDATDLPRPFGGIAMLLLSVGIIVVLLIILSVAALVGCLVCFVLSLPVISVVHLVEKARGKRSSNNEPQAAAE